MKKSNLERIFINPFSDKFIQYWDLWKEYKKEQHKFTYKSVISEQGAANFLFDLSKGNEGIALAIIKQSIAQGWKGFFSLKNENTYVNGNGKTHRNGSQSITAGGQDPTVINREGAGQL